MDTLTLQNNSPTSGRGPTTDNSTEPGEACDGSVVIPKRPGGRSTRPGMESSYDIRRLVVGLSFYALTGGAVTLIGWFAKLPQLTDWIASGISMFANTALASMAAATALLLKPYNSRAAVCFSIALGALVVLLGGGTLFQHLTGFNLGIDQLLISPSWGQKAAVVVGRMGPPASISFLLIGVGILLARAKCFRPVIPVLGIVVAAISMLSIVGYAFDADPLFTVAKYTGIALQTATILLALGVALIASEPDLEPARTLRQNTAAGLLARRILPFVILLPVALGWLFIVGRNATWFDRGMGTAMLVLILIGLLSGLTWSCIKAVAAHENASRASEERFRNIFNQTTAGIVQVDLDGRFLLVNQRFCEITGFSADQLQSKTCPGLTHPDDQLLNQEMFKKALRDKKPFVIEKRYVRSDGSQVWVRNNVSVITNDRGEVENLLAASVDITEQKRTEQLLRSKENQLRLVTDNAPVFLAHCDRDGRYIFVNEPYAARFGYRAEQLFGKHISDGIGEEAFEKIRPYVEKALAGESVAFEVELPYGKLGSRWMSAHYVPDFDEKNNVRGLVAAIVEITQRKQAEEALRQSEAEFRLLAESVPHMVWTARADGSIDYSNSKWCEFTGLSLEETHGSGWTRAVHPEDVDRSKEAWNVAVSTGARYEVEYRFRRASDNTYRWHIGRATPVRDQDGRILKWFGTCTDIDDQKRASERLEQIVEERTARLRETIGELEAFSYSIAHDMRSPLRAMQGFAQILSEECSDKLSADGQEYLRRIANAAQRMDRLIQDVLTYSRVARSDIALGPVDLDSLIRSLLESYPQFHGPQVKITPRSPLGVVLGNEAALTQCFSNLLGNAIKFVKPAVTPDILIWSESRDTTLRVWVQDNGIGISPDQHERIFCIFQRLNKGYDGTGIGLAIVKKAVERMGGKVGIESELDKGSRFWVELPIAPETMP